MKNKSFTLIELLVVIAIIGILSGVILVSTASSTDKAILAKAQAFSTTTQAQLGYDLLSEWKFDNTFDLGEDTGKANNCTIHNATYKDSSLGECASGGCYSFDGYTSYIDCGGSNLMGVSNEFSGFSWIKISSSVSDATRIGAVVSNYSHSPHFALEVLSLGRLRFYWNAGQIDFSVTNKDLRDNNWHFVGFVHDLDNDIVKLYIDGEVRASKSAAGTILNLAWPVRVGGDFRATPGIPFIGYIDDARLYKGILTSSQIRQQYIAGLDSMLAKNLISKEEYNERVELLGKN
ncbi:MAG: prepilin-type N-terminal cleavage/methylation domain-containing protein [Candidatus Pacebacteria bacterium]|nr:prepilin-type N-terminal cleavage/methylation domain-containing protein [Candidatus Paceibacterota bacterium]MDD3919319.1 prepilin-type N-terminal cleavage/methylation domain-containing protein [Candidatus Paceibacterota bacterium]